MAVKSIKTFKKAIPPSDTYPIRGKYIHQEVSNFKVKKLWPLFRMPAPKNIRLQIYDLGVIICVYGHDSQRIAATKGALSWILKSKPMPNIYFLEAAKAGESYEFEDYLADIERVTYIKKTIPAEADGLWLKEGLWTIAANYAITHNIKLKKLCFIDSDVEFGDQMWADEVGSVLNSCDVIAPHSHYYHEGLEVAAEYRLIPSTPYAILNNRKGINHPGMAFACTVDFFKNRLNSEFKIVASGGGDVYLWGKILGDNAVINNNKNKLAYHLTFPHNKGMIPKPKVGHASQIAVHRYHGPIDTRLYHPKHVLTKRAIDEPHSEYKYDSTGMPVWNTDTPGGNILARAFPRLYSLSSDDSKDISKITNIYEEEAISEYGEINDTYPLTVVCVLKDNIQDQAFKVIALKQQFENKLQVPHRFLCISNIAIDGVETIPFNTTLHNDCVPPHVFALNISDNTSVLYCDINTVLYNNILPHRAPENTIALIRASSINSPIGWGNWSDKLMYFRGSAYSNIYNRFLELVDIEYDYYSSVNVLLELMLKNQVYPSNIEQHFCARFYNDNIPSETQMVIFQNTDPVTITADWMPNYLVP